MSFKLGDTMDKYGIDYRQLAKKCGRAVNSVYDDAYRRGVKKRFMAMAYAYALDCDIRQILEPTNKLENEGWDEPCLPGCEL